MTLICTIIGSSEGFTPLKLNLTVASSPPSFCVIRFVSWQLYS